MCFRNTIPPVFLIGARASGKSTVGRLLAEGLNLAFADTDARIRGADGREAREIVAAEGWPAFRAREKAALRECTAPGTVISSGGGMVLDEENRLFMRANGVVFYLEAPAKLLRERMLADPEPGLRPPLTGRPPADEIEHVLAEREALYLSTAHHRIDAALPPERAAKAIADRILKKDAAGHAV
jgi:shikimate kinase